jgi:hypothetical protein
LDFYNRRAPKTWCQVTSNSSEKLDLEGGTIPTKVGTLQNKASTKPLVVAEKTIKWQSI